MITVTVSVFGLREKISTTIAQREEGQNLFKLTFRSRSISLDGYSTDIMCITNVEKKTEVMVKTLALVSLNRVLDMLEDQPITLMVDPSNTNHPFSIISAAI